MRSRYGGAGVLGLAAIIAGLAGAEASVVQAFGFNCVAFAVLAGKGPDA